MCVPSIHSALLFWVTRWKVSAWNVNEFFRLLVSFGHPLPHRLITRDIICFGPHKCESITLFDR